MDSVTHFGINLFPLLLLLIIFFSNRKNAGKKKDESWFRILNILMILFFFVDILYWGVGSERSEIPRVVIWELNMLYEILVGAGACAWLNYVFCKIGGEMEPGALDRVLRCVGCIFGVYVLLVMTAPWTGLMFSIGQEQEFLKGPLFALQYILCIISAIISSIAAFYRMRRENSGERRRECVYLILLGLISCGGVLLQFLVRGWWLGASCITVGLLIIYINMQNQQITTDSLTGLNNRYEFDKYIRRKAEEKSDGAWGLLMMDLDDFKKINDTYGHAVGDEALWNATEILRHAMGMDKNFLARYGGDEFVVIGDWQSEQEILQMTERLDMEVRQYNMQEGIPCKLSFSVGHALWSENEGGTVESLIEKADNRMYQIKVKKKKARQA